MFGQLNRSAIYSCHDQRNASHHLGQYTDRLEPSRAAPTYHAHQVNDDEIQIPIIKSYQLKVGPNDYPPESRTLHQEGDCTIRSLIDQGGTPTEVSVSKSTGFPTLDQGCVQAIQ